MRWQDVSKALTGLGTVGVIGLFSYLFLLTGMDYTHSGDSDCGYVDGIYQCESYINISTRYWNFEFEHLDHDSYIYLPADLEDFTGKLIRYRAGDLDFVPTLYKKSTRGRKLWINLNQINNIIDTQPSIKVDWMVPARGKDNWRLVKEGDTWSRLKNNRIKLVGYPENEFDNIKWSFVVGEVDIDPMWNSGVGCNIKKKKNMVEIKFNNKKDYNIKEEAEKVGLKAKDYMNVKKTKYYGDVDIRLMHYKNVTINQSYNCNCHNETNISVNGTETKTVICTTCYKDITNEIFMEVDPETFVLKNNEPIYEVMEKTTKFEKMSDGWGYVVWTDVNIMGVEIKGATWWNATFEKKREIQINNTDLEVSNYSLLLNVTYDSDMSAGFEDIRFANSSENEVLSYWIENKVDGLYADVWVKIPYILTNTTNTTVYMYYDNTSVVSSESDIINAGLYGRSSFSDLNDFTNQEGNWAASNGNISVSNNGGVADNVLWITSLAQDYTNVEIMWSSKQIANNNYGSISGMFLRASDLGDTFSGYICGAYDTGTDKMRLIRSVNGGHGDISSIITKTLGTDWVNWKFQINGSRLRCKQWQAVDSEVTSWDFDTTDAQFGSAGYIGLYSYDYASLNVLFNTIFVHKMLSTTPTYSFGVEENEIILPTITIESPTNKTYNTKTVWFNVTLDKIGSWCGYSLDGADNITMTNSSGNWNAVNTSMWDSYHTVIFSCNDTSGNMNSTTTMGFTSQYENVTRCTTLDATYRTYYLRNDIIDSGTSNCIDIITNHIIFDGLGYIIDGNDVADYGISMGRFGTGSYINTTIKNCNIRDWDTMGIHGYGISRGGGTIDNVNISSCPGSGIYLDYSNNQYNIINSIFEDNKYGIYILRDDNNIFDNLTFKNNSYGLWIAHNTDNNVLTNSTFENNTISFYFDEAGISQFCPSNIQMYNNLFNDTTYWGTDNCNLPSLTLNTTQQTGTRIHSNGVEIGGNYWTNSTGNGYSDTCIDANKDGFCDVAYTIDTGVIDYLSYSDGYEYSVVLYLNGTSASRYYEQGTYSNLTAIRKDYLGNIYVSDIWLDIDMLGYGTNYKTSSTGIVHYDFETHAIENDIINYESVADFEGEEQCCGSFVYDGWNFFVGEGGVVANALATHGSNIVSIDRYLPQYYGGISKNTTTEYMLFDIVYCTDNVNVVVYSDYLVVYNKSCSVERNVNVDLGTMGVNKLVNITSEGLGNWVPTFGFDYVRLFNDEITSYEFTVDVLERTTKHVGWLLNVYDDIDSIEFNLTGSLGPSVAGNDPVSRVGSQGTSLSIIDRNNPITTDGNLTRYEFYTPSSGKFNFKVYRNNGTHFIVVNETGNINFLTGFNSFTTFMTVLEGDLIGGYLYPTGGSAINVLYTGSSAWATGDKGTDLISNWNNANDALTFSLIAYTNNNETYPSNISIDVNQDGLDKYYPLASLIGENEFYSNKMSTNEIKTNLTFDTAESNTFDISFPTDGFDYERGTFNLTGYPFTVSQQSTLFDNATANFSIKNINSNLWIYDINTTGVISAGITIRFPHYITEEGGNVHPVKIYNITETADEDSTVLVIGEKWGGNSSLRQNPTNSSEIEWTPHLTLPDNSIFRIVIGKNVTWDNETSAKEIAINLTTTVPHLYMKLESTHLQSEETQTTDACSTTTECVYTCWGSPCLYYNCEFSRWDEYCAGTGPGYAKDCNDNMGNCNGGVATGYLNYIFYNYDTISDIAFRYSHYTYGYSLNIDFYYYNKYVLGYEYIFSKGYGAWYQPTQTTTSPYTDADEYISDTGEFKVKQVMTDNGPGHDSRFWKPYLIYNRSVYNPEVKLFSTIIWYYNGLMDSNNDVSTSDDLSGYINTYEETDFLFNFTSDGRYGELLIYFEPFWTSSPENITVQVGDSTDYIYQNTTVFNTTEEINISIADEIKNYIRLNCENEVSCDVPFRISSAKAGVLEVSNINFTYSYGTIALDQADITSGTPVIDLVYYDSNITIDDLNVTYYGSKNITVVAHNADYSINDSHDIMVVFSNFSIAYPYSFMDFLYWTPYTNDIQNVEPNLQSSTKPGITFTSLAYDQKFDIYMKTDNQLACLNTSIYTERNVSNEIEIKNSSYTKVVDNINIRTDAPDYNETWLWRDYNNCNGTEYRYYSPNIIIYGKCTECV